MQAMQAIVEDHARKAWKQAWSAPRWAFRHGDHGRPILLLPAASAALEAGAPDGTELPLGDDGMRGRVQESRTEIAVDGNVHKLLRARATPPQDIEVGAGLHSPHLDVPQFLTEVQIATGLSPARVHVYIGATGSVDAALAPSDAWVDPLIRRCFVDHLCVQQFIGKYKIGGVMRQDLLRLFGWHNYRQHPDGTPDALAPFMAPVRVLLDDRWVVDAHYHHSISELLDALPPGPVYLHGVPLRRCGLALWTLSPVGHGVIHLYRTGAARYEQRTIMGGTIALPEFHSAAAFVPCPESFTGNAFAPRLHCTPDELAAVAPAQPTRLFMTLITQGEPMTISRALCIYEHLSPLYTVTTLRDVLLDMALPKQREPLQTLLGSASNVHPTFETFVKQLAIALRATLV